MISWRREGDKAKAKIGFLVLSIMMLGCVLPRALLGENIAGGDVVVPADIVFVLDNSGSMKKNDPGFLVRAAVEQLATGAARDTRMAMVTCDEVVDLVTPLTFGAGSGEWPGFTNLEQLDYQGLVSNIVGGVERALQELTRNGRKQAVRSIVLVTDGGADTGDSALAGDRARWLFRQLRSPHGDTKVHIYGIALSDTADFDFLRSLAIETQGEYFYAEHAPEILPIFTRVSLAVRGKQSRASGQSPHLRTSQGSEVRVNAGMVSTGLPALGARPAPGSTDRYLTAGWLAGATVALLSVAFLITRTFLHRRQGWPLARGPMIFPVAARRAPRVPQGYLYDLGRVTKRRRYELSHTVTVIGRGLPRSSVHTTGAIVIAKPTISRRHATIEYREDGFWVRDENSRNGTFVNGGRVIGATHLRHGDRIRFHSWDFELELSGFEDDYETVMVGHSNWPRRVTNY